MKKEERIEKYKELQNRLNRDTNFENMSIERGDAMDLEMSSGKQELWTHRERKGFMWGKQNKQAMKKW